MALAGCTLHASRQAALPPPPKPAAAVKPVAEPPLSIPQTSASLPSPQPVNAAAIPPDPPQEPAAAPEKTEAPPAVHNAKRPTGPAGPSTKPQETPAVPDTEEPVAVAPPASERAPLQPIMTEEQQKQLKASFAAQKRDTTNLLSRAGEHAGNDQTLIDHIKSFLKLADDAAQRGDYTQADDLSKRALILAQELQVE